MRFPSLALLCYVVPSLTLSETALDDILLSDIIGEVLLDHTSNDKCNPSTASGTFSYSFDFSEPYFDPLLTSNEKVLFLAEMKHEDPNPDMSWAIRVGQAGNIYSYRGPLGETMPVNRMPGNYMVDEVWQSVAVDTRLNDGENNHPNGKYFIHQAGAFQRDAPFTDAPFFFSPSIAKHCDQIKRQCLFASWGQHAHIPTKFISKAIYVNRYRDCGDGVLEFTSVVVNADNNKAEDLHDYGIDHSLPTKFNYMSFPWFGVRDTIYRDVLIKNNKVTTDDQNWLTQFPPPIFSNHVTQELPDTGGFTVFAQNLNITHRGDFVFPGLWSDPDSAPDFVVGLLAEKRVPCEPWRSHSFKFQAYHVRCKLNTEVTFIQRCPGCELTLTNKNTREFIDVVHVEHWSWLTDVGIHAGDHHIYFAPKIGANGKRWTWAEYDVDFAEMVADEVNKIFTETSEIAISWTDSGLHNDDNYCFALVHGVDQEIKSYLNGNGGDTVKYWDGFGKVQWGSAYSYERQFMALNEVQNINIEPGVTFGRNQYIITTKGLDEMDRRAQEWVNASIQDFNNIGDLPGTKINLFSNYDGTKFGITLGEHSCDGVAVCIGYSTPQYEPMKDFTLPHFQITCGNQTYFGPDINHFSPFDSSGIIRTYICDESDYAVRPTVKLMGYFAEGSCAALETFTYDDGHCNLVGLPTNETSYPSVQRLSPSNVPTQTLSPSNVPTQTLSPSKVPTQTLSPSKVPTQTLSPSNVPTQTLSPSNVPTQTLSPSKVPTQTLSPSNVPTQTLSPYNVPAQTLSPSKVPTQTLPPSKVPTQTLSPSNVPTQTLSPSKVPTQTLSPSKALVQTLSPSKALVQTLSPSRAPVAMPDSWSTLTTTFNGKFRSYGAMFDVEAMNNITILGFDVNAVPRWPKVKVEIFTKEGSYVGNENNSKKWFLICKTSISTRVKGKPSSIPIKETVPINIRSGNKQAFYITFLLPLMKNSKSGVRGDVLTSNDDLKVFVGDSKFYYFDTPRRNRAWNGNIHYIHGQSKINYKDFSVRGLGRRFNLKWYKKKKKRRPIYYKGDKLPKSPWKN